MKIGIIVHSFTGNTLLVAQKISEALTQAGHTVALERVTVKDENPNAANAIALAAAPAAAGYDLVLFGAPVRAFSLSPGMKVYLSQMNVLQGGRVACFVTQQLPYPWMGARHALRQMENAVAIKGGKTLVTGSVSWSSKAKEAQIDRLATTILTVAAKQAGKEQL